VGRLEAVLVAGSGVAMAELDVGIVPAAS
jgi:hypothetical protein